MPFPPVHPSLQAALTKRGYDEPTSVQSAVLTKGEGDADLLVSAKTGSGKTVAFGLAIASTLLGDAERFGPAAKPLALAVAPTRELAMQVHRELSWLYAETGCRLVTCVGGMDMRQERRALERGAHIVVGTPGRLCDHLQRGHLVASEMRAVILDEADEMLDLGFREDLERILDLTPPTRRTLLFSATIPSGIAGIARRYQKNAIRIASSSQDEPHGDIEYRALPIAPYDRDHAVVNVLRYFEVRGALVFCRTRDGVTQLHGNLLERGFSVVALSGELTQAERSRALQSLRDGRARVCVATDVAARGIDLPDLGLVIHADLPNDPQVLVHRSGRTGRAGRKGICVLLVPFPARRRADQLLRAANIPAKWSPPPSADAVREKDQTRMVAELGGLSEDLTEEELAAARPLLEERSPEQLAAVLMRLHRRTLPAPEELVASVSGPPPPRERRSRRPTGDTSRYRLNVGADRNADPRWLVPFLCRRGHITKADIGRIQIGDSDTEFEIAQDVAARFESAIRRPDKIDSNLRIEPLGSDTGPPSGKPPRRRRVVSATDDGAGPPYKRRSPRGAKKPNREGEGIGSGKASGGKPQKAANRKHKKSAGKKSSKANA